MVYVLSDIHGNERRFNSILEQINLQPTDTLYILGDVIDRHPGGIRILRKIMKMSNVKMLLGNHEYMMLNALGCPYDATENSNEFLQRKALRLWYSNGGKVTHDYLKHIRKTLRLEIVEFLRALPLNIDVTVKGTQYKLVHAAPVEDFDNAVYDNPTQFAVWERRYEVDIPARDYVLVFGHTPTAYYQRSIPMEPWYGDNCIGVDCGCGYPETGFDWHLGRLACLCLDNGKAFFSDESKSSRNMVIAQ